jgi:heparan-sulfate lyase
LDTKRLKENLEVIRPIGIFLLLGMSPLFDAHGGEVLDEILNCMKLGVHTRSRSQEASCSVDRQRRVGQTFVVSDRARKVKRVAVWQAFWHESWGPDEVLVMTLWDSPQKKATLGRYAIPYDRRMWEDATPMFTLDSVVEQGRSYFFELTVEIQPLRPATVPTDWLLSGVRPGFAGGDGEIGGIGIAQDDYPDGTAYIGGKPQDYDLWFEIHEVRETDRDALCEEVFARYDLERPELVAVRGAVLERDWDRAVAELVRHFESRSDLFPPGCGVSEFNAEFDTREADLAAEHKVLLSDGTTVDLGPEWNHYTLWPERGGVGLTRSGLRKHLAAAYRNTGNEKYGRAWNDMLYHLFTQSPSPVRAAVLPPDGPLGPTPPARLGGGSMWNGLSLGARLGHGFYYYGAFLESPSFDADIRAAFIINLGEMADVFSRMKGGGNWDAQMSKGLFELGLNYPEYRKAKAWVAKGFDGIVNNALANVWPDGVAREPTLNYHGMMMRRYAHVIRKSKSLGLEPPPRMAELTGKMYEFAMHATQPDGYLAPWGDTWPGSVPEDLVRDATFFSRRDFLYVGSRGEHGDPPQQTSCGFPEGGFYFMRTGWDRDAHFMSVHAGPFGSHGHKDALSMIVSSFGSTILIDPGICTYGTPEAERLSSSRSHNMVTVDGCDARSAEAIVWTPGERFDFLAGVNHGYEGVPGCHHYRRIWFLKPTMGFPGLWMVFDDVTGAGEHEAVLRYHYSKIPVEEDHARARFMSGGKEGNLVTDILDASSSEMHLGEALATLPGVNGLTTVPAATVRRAGPMPASFSSLLVPFRGDSIPDYSARLVPVGSAGSGSRGVWFTMGGKAVLCLSNSLDSYTQEPPVLTAGISELGEVHMQGAGAVVRFTSAGARWEPIFLHGVKIRQFALDAESLFASQEWSEQADIDLTNRSSRFRNGERGK